MGKLENVGIAFIRDVFKRDNQRHKLAVSTKELAHNAGRLSAFGASIDAQMNGDLRSILFLDRRMLHRYADYEEMDEYSDVSSALDIYADDATQVDSQRNRTVWIESSDDQIRSELTELFDKRIGIDNIIWEWARTVCKYGNDFEEILVGENGVSGISFLPAPTMRRIENKRGDLLGFVQTFSDTMDITQDQFEKFRIQGGAKVSDSGDVAAFEDWRVVHTRLTSKYRESMYGWAVIDAARWVWKRLMLLEDAVLVYKLTRSPSRYAFYVDVGKASRQEAERILQETMHRLKKRKFVNPKTGKLDLRANPMAMDQDFFLAMRDGRESTRVESLMGPSYQQVDDVQYFLYKLYAALKVPRAYMGYDENMPSKATLSQEDVRFARTILRVQRELRNGLGKIAKVDLAARRIDPMAVDYEVKMTVPSSIFELGQMEVRRARADLASLMERHVSLFWLLKNVYGMSDTEIEEVTAQRKKDSAERPAQGVGLESVGRSAYQGTAHRGRHITERELFAGNREHEKAIEDRVMRSLGSPDSVIGRQLKETGLFLREILNAVKTIDNRRSV